MSTHKYAVPNSVETVLTTELDSLAAGTVAISAAIDNTSGLYKFADMQVFSNASATAGDFCSLFIVEGLDGTNYEDAVNSSGETLLVAAQLAGNMRRYHSGDELHIIRGVVLPPTKFKVAFAHYFSSNLNATDNTVKLIRYNEQDV